MSNIKHRVTIEIELPEDYPDLCWTSEGAGPQVFYDLFKKTTETYFFQQICKAMGRTDIDETARKQLVQHLDVQADIARYTQVIEEN